MDKRMLSKVARPEATKEMVEMAERLRGMKHIVTAQLIEDNKILLLNFFEVSKLKNGKTEAAFRTFLSSDDYITQDLSVSKVKWKTASFYMMRDFELFESHWNSEKHRYDHTELVFIWSKEDLAIMKEFLAEYLSEKHKYDPWTAINDLQQKVMAARLQARYKKETDPIDALMDTVKDVPEEFVKWSFDEAMGFSRYLIYEEVKKGIAVCECTHCGKTGTVDRKKIRLRNNEKGNCPFCESTVTIKAKGKMPCKITDERWTVYIDRTEKGFIWRAFRVHREIFKVPEACYTRQRVSQGMHEYQRSFYTFEGGTPKCDSYEYAEYKQSGKTRWCHDEGKICSGLCILYPDNLPQAWEHTPMKYSALEILSRNLPTVSMRYEWGIKAYLKHPFLEWLIKMGLNKIAEGVMADNFSGNTGKLNCSGKTIYQILGLDKVNTRVLQQIDGSYDELRLLQVAQQIGLQLKPEQLRGYYEAFGCNTDLLKQSGRKVSLHKLVKYITKESENYPIGDAGRCWRYSYMQYKEREDPRIERKRNTAKDWLEYLRWCEEMKYDLDNMFIYMPTNFKKVHDRTAKEYQDYKDAQMRKRQEQMEKKIKKALADAAGLPAMMMKAKGLIIIIPKSGNEIKEEGRILHHCVGTYVERVARGETLILFVRKETEPDVPYFTLEYREGKVIQCRGRNNCGMPQDVKAFVKAFERKMQGEEKEEKSGKERKAG